ncbi:tetratricopeptide repeat protein [Pelagibacterium montanilacus]|uniref:tetratricopeptide repeat protein n=1 Tax=Pelagibacterium montanilacus TaxID=2185280 RepID=UPI001FE70DAA|nr:tetratricopeptide repeat protein [Pelagibacterium montanilacus]
MYQVKRAALRLSVVCLAFVPAVPAWTQSFFPSFQSSATGSYLAGTAALNRLDAGTASEYFAQAAMAEPGNAEFLRSAFLAHLLAGNISSAQLLAQDLSDADAGDELAGITLGIIALKQRRYASAEQTLGRIAPNTLMGGAAGILSAWATVGKGDLEGAYETLDTVPQGLFENFLVLYRGLMADVAGDRQQALSFTRQAYDLDPLVPRTAEAHIRILGNAGEFEEAAEVLADFQAAGPVHPLVRALEEPISAQRRPGVFAQSAQAGAAETLFSLGAALAREGSIELGVIFLRYAIYLDPESWVISTSLAEILSAREQFEEANALYASVPESYPLHGTATIRLAENLDRQGQREEAIEQLRGIVALEPDNIEALGALGDLLRYDEQWDASAQAYSDLIAQIDGDRPRDWRYFYVRGIAYERAQRWELAEADFLRALEINPDHPDVLNYLGYSWVDQGINLEQALEMIEQAVALSPGNGYIIDSLGWAFYRLGRVDEAVEQLEQAARILPNDPEVNDHLGDAYWVAGREREARFQWRIAIDVDERGTVTDRARPKLANGLDPDAPVGD